jgi:acetylglutamate kinase
MSEKNLTVIKIGGKLVDDEMRLKRFLASFARAKGPKILVHGGGSLATRVSRSLGIEPKLSAGRRITSEREIPVVTMVYAGWINKMIVAGLQVEGCAALGLSGADANTIRARKRKVETVDYGWVGDVEQVNTAFLQMLLNQGLTPVFCAITHDGNGHLLNTNADTVAAEIASSMSGIFPTHLIYCFEKKGVLKNVEEETSVIRRLDYKAFRTAAEKGTVHKGMLPKLQTGFQALQKGVQSVLIGDETILNENAELFTKLIK